MLPFIANTIFVFCERSRKGKREGRLMGLWNIWGCNHNFAFKFPPFLFYTIKTFIGPYTNTNFFVITLSGWMQELQSRSLLAFGHFVGLSERRVPLSDHVRIKSLFFIDEIEAILQKRTKKPTSPGVTQWPRSPNRLFKIETDLIRVEVTLCSSQKKTCFVQWRTCLFK